MKSILLIITFLFPVSIISAQYIQFNGKVLDAESGKAIDGVSISLNVPAENDLKGKIIDFSVTDIHGSFRLKTDSLGTFILTASILGYNKVEKEISTDSSPDLIIEMEMAAIPLNEINVTSSKINNSYYETSVPVAMVLQDDIMKQSLNTMPDALKHEPGISIVKDGAWATSINIRGVSDQRIVTMVDGNRIETATDIAGALAMIDINDIEKIEVIKGACSSLYGNGAMGGIVNVITKKGNYNNKFYLNGLASGEYSSVNHMKGESISIFTGHRYWHGKISLHNRNAENINTPDGIQENSQFNDQGLSANFSVIPLKDHELQLNFQHFRAWDVGIPGGKSFPAPSMATYQLAGRDLFEGNYNIKNPVPFLAGIELKFFNQVVSREVELLPNLPSKISGNLSITSEKITPEGIHSTTGILFQQEWNTVRNNSLITGIDLWQRSLISSREKFIRTDVHDSLGNIISTIKTIRGEEPIPSSKFRSIGLYLQDELKLLNNDLELILGGRLDHVSWSNKIAVDPVYLVINGVRNDDPPRQIITFPEIENSQFTWSLNITMQYHINDHFLTTLNLARSFRAPSLEERYKYIDLGSRVELGNPDLKSEDGYFADTGLKLFLKRLNFSGNAYINYFKNLIALAPADSVSFPYSDPALGETQKIYAMKNYNIDRSVLYGYDFRVDYNISRKITLYSILSQVWGKDLSDHGNLPFIPPLNGSSGIRMRVPKYFELSITATYYKEQNKVAEGETATGGFAIMDVLVNSDPVHLKYINLRFYGGIQNLFDTSYRYHLTTNRGINQLEPGRNFYIKAEISW